MGKKMKIRLYGDSLIDNYIDYDPRFDDEPRCEFIEAVREFLGKDYKCDLTSKIVGETEEDIEEEIYLEIERLEAEQ